MTTIAHRLETRTGLADRAPLAGLLGLAAVLYLWGLTRNGYANEFYAAAVKAGTQSWKAFLFGSLDASNYITVDKPPASLWLMELSGRIFGFSSFSLLLPQALAGVASVGLLYATVRHWFGRTAALLSGLILALTPVAALMFRFDNPDALLVLLLVAGAYAVTRALEHAGTWWLALAGALLGFAFLTKMLQAFLVLPAFALVYLVAAPTSLRRRIGQVLLAGLALVVASGWWVALVELWPAASRPYIGGSTNNSVIDLIWGYNGLGRLESSGGGPGGGFSGSAGLLRLFDLQMGSQIAWLLPAALIVLVAGIVTTLRSPRTDRTRAALLLWGGWLVVTAGVFSFMTGVIHPYYTNTLAPPIAVLVGTGAVLLWRKRASVAASLVLATMVAASAAWSFRLLDRTPDWHPLLRYAVLFSGLGAAAALAIAPTRAPRRALATAALVAALAGPAAYTLSTVTTAYAGSTPAAGPATASGGIPGGRPSGGVSTQLAALLEQNASKYAWVAATSSSMSAAPIELATGKAAMAIGGFTGSDPSITLARFEQAVAAGKIHYYVAGGQGGPGGGRGGASSAIESWVTSTFAAKTVGGATVYDLTVKA